jgi:dTDP-4-dehydrorhamnose 3,5-epimerase
VQLAPTEIDNLYRVVATSHDDDRGTFVRLWDDAAFRSRLRCSPLVPTTCSLSRNHQAGTLRGMHLQVAPHEEVKLVRCLRGAIFDVAVDLRPESPTFLGWYGEVLSAKNQAALLISEGLAHGFVTLEPEAEVLYLMSGQYSAEHARGIRWDDPAIGISWPRQPSVLSERDASYPDLDITALWSDQ